MRRPSVLTVLLVAAGLAGCGNSTHQRVNPERMLDAATLHSISSARVEAEVHLQVLGVEQLSGPLRLRLDGPYVSARDRIPSFDWRLSASAVGFPIGGRLVSTGENVYLSLYGDNYELGTPAVAAANERISQSAAATGHPLDLRPRSWFGPARIVGDGSAGGADCERISAPLRGDTTAGELAPLAGTLGLPKLLTVSGTIKACIGYDDRLFHELEVEAVIGVPAADRERLGGATGAKLDADVVLSDIGEPQRITAPGGGGFRPIRDLLLTLRDLGVPVPL